MTEMEIFFMGKLASLPQWSSKGVAVPVECNSLLVINKSQNNGIQLHIAWGTGIKRADERHGNPPPR